MLVNAMTPFSMTAHMAVESGVAGGSFCVGASLVTRDCDCRRIPCDRPSSGRLSSRFRGAVPVVAVEGKALAVVLVYALAYAAIILWWIKYPQPSGCSIRERQVAASAMGESHRNFVTERVLPLLLHRTPGTTGLMVLNMLRFFAWQNFALLPLLVAAVPIALRDRGLPRALLLGIVLWLAIVTLILPYQGLGWGYRYLSPYLGSFALLAGFGYRELAPRLNDRADGLVLALSGITATVALPALFISTHSFAEPYIALERLVARQQIPFVVIDTAVSNPPDQGWALHPLDQVRNLPDLSDRPIRLSGNRVNAEMIERLCDKGPVTMVTRGDMHRVGFMLNVPEQSPRFENLIKQVGQSKPACLRPVFPSRR